MYIIYSDESDKHGAYFSNFYGGIIINSAHIAEFTNRISAAIKECGIDEEIKWQKVNVYTRQKYELIIDELFSLLDEGKARIRIFFTQNRNRPVGLTEEQRKNSYTILYYQFLKHAFGLKYAPCGEDNRIQILIDEMPIPDSQRKDFKKYLYALNEMRALKRFAEEAILTKNNTVKIDKYDDVKDRWQILEKYLRAYKIGLDYGADTWTFREGEPISLARRLGDLIDDATAQRKNASRMASAAWLSALAAVVSSAAALVALCA